MKNFRTALLPAMLLMLAACSTQHRINILTASDARARLALPADHELRKFGDNEQKRDTLHVVDLDGHDMLIMNAVRDEDGDMVATDRITASYVTARFRNVAERHGKVDLEFQVVVPKDMQHSKWQLRLNPDMYILGDSLRLEPVIITGADYRKAQLRGYQHYRKFIDSIITDTTRFINLRALEIFLERNLPQVYAFRNDSSYVSDEQFASAYGVTEKQAVDHYTYLIWKRWNRYRAGRKDIMFQRYVKAPLVSGGIRLDTVIVAGNGDFIYNYVQTINSRPGLKKVDIVLSGDIREQDKTVYTIPRSDALTFYISSISGLADNSEKYLEKIISRRVEANTASYIEFPMGKSDINPLLGNNPTEIGRIKGNIRGLIVNEIYELDSISVVAFASPEGQQRANERLSESRARCASLYFRDFAGELRDSLEAERGTFLSLNEEITQGTIIPTIGFNGRSGGENWHMLDVLVDQDKDLDHAAKSRYKELVTQFADYDSREKEISKEPFYKHLREHLYPRLRIVKFNFYLHRKNMVQDTLYTTELDTCYMKGVQYIKDRNYEEALKLLRPYNDYNTAVACVALDRNASAMQILSGLEKNARVNYLLAILYARDGDERNAVEHFIHSCHQEPAFIHRGSLDPEISSLIRKYELKLDN
ncbi:MAG: hypothetical protein J6O51_10410 [Bacteroidales bacterium]|nr:hypothetical protein [Bacteroidales bacterium]